MRFVILGHQDKPERLRPIYGKSGAATLTSRGPGRFPAHNGQRYAFTRGGVRCMNHSLTPAITATMMPVTTWTHVAVAWTAGT